MTRDADEVDGGRSALHSEPALGGRLDMGDQFGFGGEQFHVVVADGIVLDRLMATRLARQLKAQPPHIAAVLARPVPVPGGSSPRVMAERRDAEISAMAQSSLEAVTTDDVRAGGVARVGATISTSADVLALGGAQVLIDPGAVAAEPTAPLQPLPDADPCGRPLFSRRPVVLLACHGDDRSQLAAGLALLGELVDHEVEARLAVAGTPALALEPTTLGPCALSPTTVASLQPDVTVAYDSRLARQVEGWMTQRRSVLIEVTAGIGDAIERVAAAERIGRPRLAARMGASVEVPALVAFVNRLCGGPQPVLAVDVDVVIDGIERSVKARADDGWPEVRYRFSSRRSAGGPIRTIGLLAPASQGLDRARWNCVRDQFELAGCAVTAITASEIDAVDLVICGTGLDASTRRVLTRRVEADRLACALIGHHDVGLSDGAALSDEAFELARALKRALVPSRWLERALGSVEGTSARHLHTRPDRQRVAVLRRLALQSPTPPSNTIGWFLASTARTSDPSYPDGLVEGLVAARLEALLEAHRDLTLTIVGRPTALTDRLVGDPRVRLVDELDVVDCAGWVASLWTPDPDRLQRSAEDLTALELALAGVPVVAEDSVKALLGGVPLAGLDDLPALVRGDGSSTAGVAGDRAAALYGSQSALVSAHRLIGWLSRVGAPR